MGRSDEAQRRLRGGRLLSWRRRPLLAGGCGSGSGRSDTGHVRRGAGGATASRRPAEVDRDRGVLAPPRAGNRLHLQPGAGPEGATIEVGVDAAAVRPRSGSTSTGCCRTAGTPRTRTSTRAGRPATPPARTSRTRSTRRRRRQALHRTPPTPTRRTRSGSTCARTAPATAGRGRRCRSRSPTGAPRLDRDPRGRDDRARPRARPAPRVRGWPASRCRSGSRRSMGAAASGQSRTTLSPSTATAYVRRPVRAGPSTTEPSVMA